MPNDQDFETFLFTHLLQSNSGKKKKRVAWLFRWCQKDNSWVFWHILRAYFSVFKWRITMSMFLLPRNNSSNTVHIVGEAKDVLDQSVRRELLVWCAVELTGCFLCTKHHDLPFTHIIVLHCIFTTVPVVLL